jgi:small-conductance mechanosensitive channel
VAGSRAAIITPKATTQVPPAAPQTISAVSRIQPPMTADQVISVLDQTVDWYRTLGIQQKAANEPSDMLILYDNRQTADKVVALAFEVARANAQMLESTPTAQQGDITGAGTSSQALQQFKKKLDAQTTAIQAELAAERLQLKSPKASHVEVEAKIDELQSELDLVATKQGIVTTMSGLTGAALGSGESTVSALKAQIDAMAVALPNDATATQTTPAQVAQPQAPGPASRIAPAIFALMPSLTNAGGPTVARFGLWDIASNAFHLSEKRETITSIDQRTAALQTTLAQIRTRLVDQIKGLSASGDQLAATADSADSTTLIGVRDQLDALAGEFKQASALLIPLTREDVLLSQYRRNLGNWRDAVKTQYQSEMKTLAVRVAVLLCIFALLFAAAELWKRAVLRYVQDPRRRYQLLLFRRIALWSLILVIIALAFASELGSIATFAGLITAGIAVAMQSVLVSVVGYFFLIGKYGIRVGDRVQIGDVTGEVIDIGLVRMYLMELGAKGAMGPTGRVVAYPNSVVFQVSTGLFKQIPGVNLSWREVTLHIPQTADAASIKEKLLGAITEALKDYRPEILRQTRTLERATLSGSFGDAEPQVQLRFTDTGVEANVRYPVNWQHAAEIDERVTQAIATVISLRA